jgi:histone deacetylase 11
MNTPVDLAPFLDESDTAANAESGGADAIRAALAAPLPVLYREEYDICSTALAAAAVALVHPFDTRRSARVAAAVDRVTARRSPHAQPRALYRVRRPVDDGVLLRALPHYDARFLVGLAGDAARIAEVGALAAVPRWLVDRLLLQPLRWQCAGSLVAPLLARRHGWAVNLGGGFHHAAAAAGGHASGFCFYADVGLAVHAARYALAMRGRIVVVDLDAHQGNGHERDQLAGDGGDVYIVDVYNADAYPHDDAARAGIAVERRVHDGCSDAEYLREVRAALDDAERQCADVRVDLVIYVAGSDVLRGDPLGCLAVSARGLVDRDELVFRFARRRLHAPIVMLLGGGYTAAAADVVAESLMNLARNALIDLQ